MYLISKKYGVTSISSPFLLIAVGSNDFGQLSNRESFRDLVLAT